ncbi:hypothetical protein HU200_003651 [Digitaria exilis]|uniref:Fatty acyl-CoA reductase n=1 Tax=Digitaria exilis TaxID=1010633 RepID=A0A835FTS2_9POAL|nr:hypothetical protein HU200_003651 [Digitaria exilis]
MARVAAPAAVQHVVLPRPVPNRRRRHRISKKRTHFASQEARSIGLEGGWLSFRLILPPHRPPHHARRYKLLFRRRQKDGLAAGASSRRATKLLKAGVLALVAPARSACLLLPFARSVSTRSVSIQAGSSRARSRARGGRGLASIVLCCLRFVLAPSSHLHLFFVGARERAAVMGSSCVNLSRAVVLPAGGAARRVPRQYVSGGVLRLPSSSPSLLPRRHGFSGTVAWPPPPFPAAHGIGGDAGPMSPPDHAGGIGVAEFLGAKNFLVTGGTGFLAKVLIEKILRTNPDVGKIYVLIKAKDSDAALRRLHNEEIHGKDYSSFIATKLVPVVGDVREANIGIAPELADEIAEQVDIIINSAANTTFDERFCHLMAIIKSSALLFRRYDVAMDINTVGPFRIMSFAQRFRRLKLFLQVSTGQTRQGLVLEKPFRMGDTIAKELGSSEQKGTTVLDTEAEIKLAFDYSRRHSVDSASMRGEVPVVTIRPSVIESTWRDPFPGWMEGNRMMDPVVLYYGKGQLTGFLADPEGVLDVVPADMVVNATLASMAYHGGGGASRAPGCTCTTCRRRRRFLFQHFTKCPYSDGAGQPILVPPMRLFDSMDQFASYRPVILLLRLRRRRLLAGAAAVSRQRALDLCAKSVEQTVYLGSIYQPYTFYGGRFDNGNTEALFAAMSPAEKARFHFDVRKRRLDGLHHQRASPPTSCSPAPPCDLTAGEGMRDGVYSVCRAQTVLAPPRAMMTHDHS